MTYLAKPILDRVDAKEIALTPAVELSYLSPEEQDCVLEAMDYYDCTPSYSQTVRLHRLSTQGAFHEDAVYDILGEEKANQRERIYFEAETVRRFFPRNYTEKDIQEAIISLSVISKFRMTTYRPSAKPIPARAYLSGISRTEPHRDHKRKRFGRNTIRTSVKSEKHREIKKIECP